MKNLFDIPGMGGLLAAQTQVAFNDNATKLVLIGLVQLLLPAEQALAAVSLTALLLVAPFVVLAPLTGWLADRFPRRDVVAASLWLQVGAMGVLAGAVWAQSLPLAFAGFFLLGAQSALMAPARRGLIGDLTRDRVVEAVAWMEMLCIAAILVGGLVGGQLIDRLVGWTNAPWSAAGAAIVVLTLACFAAIWVFAATPRTPVTDPPPFTVGVLTGHFRLLADLGKDRLILRAALGDAVFYLVGGFLLLAVADLARVLHPDGHGVASTTGFILALTGAGIAVGSLIAARSGKTPDALPLVVIGAALMAILLALLAATAPGRPIAFAWFFGIGVGGGLFVVPLGAVLVGRSAPENRGRVLAASSLLSSLAGVAAVGLHALCAQASGMSPQMQFLACAVVMFATALLSTLGMPDRILRTAVLAITRLHWRVRSSGANAIPARGGVLIVCNHVSYVDTIVLSLACQRTIRFLAFEGLFSVPVLGAILRLFGAIPVSPERAKDAIAAAASHLRQGDVVCVFPEGQLTRTGCLMEFKRGFEVIARRADCPVVPTQIDGLWGSVFSFSDGRYFFKLPTGLQRRVTVSFGAPIDPERATAEVVRERILEMGADAMSRRTGDDLTSLVVSGLRRAAARKVVIEHDGSHLRGITALALACLLARRWAGLTPSPRVGVILPPGCAGLLANIALLIAGKTPANLNPLTPAPVLADCLHRANITTVITATPVREKLRGVPWPQSVILIDREIRSLPRRAILSGHLRALFAPIRPPRNPEAALLFTSGSSGRPKGVLLTHANVVANITQISETNFLQRDDRLLTALPLFHSFGLTVGLILPVVRGIPIITAPSPLDADKIRDAARVGCPTLALATPTFLRHYIQRIPRDAFGTLRLALVGAERLCPKLAAAFTDRFGCDVVEGYGLTEASPVVAFNQPHPRRGLAASSVQHGHLRGTVGRLLPGIAARANDGILALRGPNVISHYMNNECPEAFAEGWFRTGDRVAFDPNGFLRIEGRAARFSKIGGEMVSHAAVEASIAAALDESPGEDCVVAVECPRKGEALVLVTTRRIETEVLRRALRDREIPNLWIPAEVVSVESVPMLASGKVDVAQCRAIVAHCHDIHR